MFVDSEKSNIPDTAQEASSTCPASYDMLKIIMSHANKLINRSSFLLY